MGRKRFTRGPSHQNDDGYYDAARQCRTCANRCPENETWHSLWMCSSCVTVQESSTHRPIDTTAAQAEAVERMKLAKKMSTAKGQKAAEQQFY